MEDFAQEAAIRVLSRLDGFRGDSRFTTWAVAVAVRVAFTELRRARWRDVSLDALAAGPGAVDPIDPAASPERQARQRAVLAALTRPVELHCGEWLVRVGRYAEAVLDGGAIPESLNLVREHMVICPECREEFEVMIEALRT